MEKIAEALKSTSTKKQNLKKAFDLVKLHSSSLNSFTLEWTDLETHFDSLQSSLQHQFNQLLLLQSKNQQQHPLTTESSLKVRAELKTFCLNMDGVGMRSFIMENRKDLVTNRDDVIYGFNYASDCGKLVLDALQGFYPLKSKKAKGGELGAIRRTCVLLLEGLEVVKPVISEDVRVETKKLAVDWRGKVSVGSDDQLEALVFLQLLASYGLVNEFNVDEVLDLLVSIARRRQAVDLFRGLGFEDKISDFIQKLNSRGKQIDAVKFVYAFDVVEKFPPVSFLKAYLEESKKVAQEVCKKGKNSVQSQNEAIAKETAYLRAIIKCIEEYKLESQYSRESIDKRIEQLEKQKVERKRAAIVAAPSPVLKSQQHQQTGSKRLRVAGSGVDVALPTIVPSSPTHLQPTRFFPEHMFPYTSSSNIYGLAGTASTLPHYMNPAAGPSGAAQLDIGASLSHLYSSESHLPPSPYDRSTGFGRYGVVPTYGSSPFY